MDPATLPTAVERELRSHDHIDPLDYSLSQARDALDSAERFETWALTTYRNAPPSKAQLAKAQWVAAVEAARMARRLFDQVRDQDGDDTGAER